MSVKISDILSREELEEAHKNAIKVERHPDLNPDNPDMVEHTYFDKNIYLEKMTDTLIRHADELTVHDLFIAAIYEKLSSTQESIRDLSFSVGREKG